MKNQTEHYQLFDTPKVITRGLISSYPKAIATMQNTGLTCQVYSDPEYDYISTIAMPVEYGIGHFAFDGAMILIFSDVMGLDLAIPQSSPIIRKGHHSHAITGRIFGSTEQDRLLIDEYITKSIACNYYDREELNSEEEA